MLILLKLVAGSITGSVAILTEAVHSSIDLIASIVAFFSVRKAGEPADEATATATRSSRTWRRRSRHLDPGRFGRDRVPGNPHLAAHEQLQSLGVGIAVVAFSMVVNLCVSVLIARNAPQDRLAGARGRRRPPADRRADVAAVLIGLALVSITGAYWLDPVVALAVASTIVVAGVRLLARSSRVLVDEALPPEEVSAIRVAVEQFGAAGVVGYHELRTRRAGSRRYVDLHIQFRRGTSLEAAHRTAHELQDVIGERLAGADVLIHLEPEDRVRPGEELGSTVLPSGRSEGASGVRGGSANKAG